jgi:hypothetical protein
MQIYDKKQQLSWPPSPCLNPDPFHYDTLGMNAEKAGSGGGIGW